MRFRDKVAVVTGAAGGIGRAIALGLAREGATVVAADRKDAAETVGLIEQAGGRGRAVQMDVGVEVDTERTVADAAAAYGTVHILVNNAGVGSLSAFLGHPLADFERVMRINVTGPFLLARTAGALMAAQRWGRIVNVASISGQRAGWKRTAYGTSKAAVIQLTKQIAMELGPLGVTCNAIGPGPVDTDMVVTGHTPQTRTAYCQMIPAGRYGTVEEMAAAVLFLCSQEAAYVNGHVLNVDGGYTSAGVKFDD